MENIAQQAQIFATAAHAAIDQRRKYTHEPYIRHPAAVVALVSTTHHGHDPNVVAAAWLHDVVEDTGVSIILIEQVFGPYVARLVGCLTDASKPEDGNRAARKKIDQDHLAQAPAEAQTIKLADLIDNTKSIVERDPDFAKVYLREKEQLLEVLTAGDHFLREKARLQIEEARSHQEPDSKEG